jgi:hypothetical protein
VFSPVKYDIKMLEMIGKKLKKNSVALDIVDFGEEDDGKPEKLEALLAAVNNNDSSHIVHIPSGANALSDVLIRWDLVFFFFGCFSYYFLNVFYILTFQIVVKKIQNFDWNNLEI